MPKTDYLDDESAPTANSLVVAVAAVVRNEHDDVLLIQRSDNGLWAIPGGGQDIGESVSQAAIREVKEETGIDVRIDRISGIYSNPNHVIAYDNGEVRQEFSICFHATPIGGAIRTSSESTIVRWCPTISIAELKMHPSMRLRITHGIEGRPEPHFD